MTRSLQSEAEKVNWQMIPRSVDLSIAGFKENGEVGEAYLIARISKDTFTFGPGRQKRFSVDSYLGKRVSNHSSFIDAPVERQRLFITTSMSVKSTSWAGLPNGTIVNGDYSTVEDTKGTVSYYEKGSAGLLVHSDKFPSRKYRVVGEYSTWTDEMLGRSFGNPAFKLAYTLTGTYFSRSGAADIPEWNKRLPSVMLPTSREESMAEKIQANASSFLNRPVQSAAIPVDTGIVEHLREGAFKYYGSVSDSFSTPNPCEAPRLDAWDDLESQFG